MANRIKKDIGRLFALLAAGAAAGADGTGPVIEWDRSTQVLIQEHGTYARIVRLPDRRLLCAYDRGQAVWVRHSRDEGRTWDEPVRVAGIAGANLTNAELLAPRDGRVLCFFNERPRPAPGEPARPHAIRSAESADGGRTWSPPDLVYVVTNGVGDGCWEPAALELPSGSIQVYFANEDPYRTSNEQEIAMRERPAGSTAWSGPVAVGYRRGHRDGMPSPLQLLSGDLVVAIEDNGLSGTFKPAILRTPPADNWRSGPVGAADTNRWGALETPLPPAVYAGAPCLRQLPSGETLLSFQQADDGNLRSSYMVVCVGDRDARHFASPSRPFPPDAGGTSAQLWSSLFVKDGRTVTAVTTSTIGGRRGIWAVDGRIKDHNLHGPR